jgi:hypothetical protein
MTHISITINKVIFPKKTSSIIQLMDVIDFKLQVEVIEFDKDVIVLGLGFTPYVDLLST